MFANTLVLITTLLLVASISIAQYDDIDHKAQQVSLGLSGSGDNSAIAAIGIFPVKRGVYSGWVGGYFNQIAADGAVSSQIVNVRAEGAVDVGRFALNAFGSWDKNKEQAIDGQAEFGGFVSTEVKIDDNTIVDLGLGNFLQNSQVEEVLGSQTAVRLMAFGIVKYGTFATKIELQPQANNLRNIDAEVAASKSYQLRDNLDLEVMVVALYKSEPFVPDEHIHFSHNLLFNLKF